MNRSTAVLTVALCLCPLARLAAQSYTVTDLGTFGGTTSRGYGINAGGAVTGQAALSEDTATHAFYRPSGGSLQDLGTLNGGINSVGYAINAAGQIAGASNFSPGSNTGNHAFFRNAGGTLIDLGTLGGPNSVGYGINATGRVAGESQVSGGATHAFLSGVNGGALQDLGTLTGGTFASGRAVNASGQVAGNSNSATSGQHAFLSDPNGGALRDLGTLSGGSLSFGLAVNDSGRVVGNSNFSGTGFRAFISAANGGALTSLGTLGGAGSSSYGLGINNNGQVVGYSFLSDNSTQHAFIVLTLGGVMIDLNSLIDTSTGTVLTQALGINDLGQVVGYGFLNGSTTEHAFLLTPVPEPGAGSLLAAGAVALVALRAARRKRSACA